MGIHWPRTVISQNVIQFETIYKRYEPESTVLFGFSAGAQVAFVAAAKSSPAVLMLASMPGWFAEDLPTRSEFHKRMVGHRRVSDYATLSFNDLAKGITARSYVFVAEKEVKPYPHFLHRAEDAHSKIKQSELIKVENAGHNISDSNYIRAIKRVVDSL